MAALQILALDTATPQIRAPTTGDTYTAIRSIGITPEVNTAGLTISGLSLTGTNAQSIVSLAGTWNTSGTPTGLLMNVTDTASNAASLLVDLQVNGISQFKVSKAGVVTVPGTGGIVISSSASGGITDNSFFKVNAFGFYNGTSGGYGFSANGAIGTIDLSLFRDAANKLALRNGVNAQEFRVYNTYTDASNNEYGYYSWASNTFRMGTFALGTGSQRSLSFQTNGSNRWLIDTSGHFIAGLDNTYDIGASGATRPRNLYVGAAGVFGSNLIAVDFQNSAGGSFYWNGRSIINSGSDGVIKISNQAQTDFSRLQFGGTTNSFGAIARDGAGISFVGAAGGSTSWIKVPGVTVANLPAAATAGAGARSFVTDALTPVFGSAVTGGGAVNVPVYSTGSAWNVG